MELLFKCPAGCDFDWAEGRWEEQPGQANKGWRESGWKVLSEEMCDRWWRSQNNREDGASRDEHQLETKGWSEWGKWMQDPVLSCGCTKILETVCDSSVNSACLTQQENIEPLLETLPESPVPNLSYSSGSTGLPHCNNSHRGQKSNTKNYFFRKP